jgi:mRNA-degrading endonuclease RelE of RelBE toxin-antitoxin system
MSFKVDVSDKFEKDLKRLSKKFPSLKKEYADLIASLKTDPFQGTPLANSCYKIRMAIASKGKGKSGGARVITHIFVTGKVVYLLTIFDKSEHKNISDKEILRILNTILR